MPKLENARRGDTLCAQYFRRIFVSGETSDESIDSRKHCACNISCASRVFKFEHPAHPASPVWSSFALLKARRSEEIWRIQRRMAAMGVCLHIEIDAMAPVRKHDRPTRSPSLRCRCRP